MFSDIFLLEKALTIAGVEGNKESPNIKERDKYDGNQAKSRKGDDNL